MRWRVIYNAVTAPPAASRTVPAARYRDDARPRVLAVGRLAYQKGFDVLLRAHQRLIAEGIFHTLTIVGDGPERAALERLISDLGITETVRLTGFVDDVASWYAGADVLAVSSRFEGFSLVILEAMLAGVPIVSTRCPSGPAELLGNNTYGILVDVEDDASLANGIRAVLTDPVRRERLHQASLQRGQDFSPRRLAREWAALIRELT